MKELNKGSAVFKHFPQDFIVEELSEKHISSVSESIESIQHLSVDLGTLNLDDPRLFLYCDLEKVNTDHFTAFSLLSVLLRKQLHEIGYAGIKDKVARTCQRISLFKPNLESIKAFSHPGLLLKNFKWAKHKIKTGDLIGNRFKIVLRDADKEAIKILSRVRNTHEIPNFFGSQRFGSLRKDNAAIGILLLKQQFKEAVVAFLTGVGKDESDEVKKAKKRLKLEKNMLAAAAYFPLQLRAEHKMLAHLKTAPQDWIGALMTLGEKVLLLMCQSVQSKLFNETLQQAIDERVELTNQSICLPGYNLRFSPGALGRIEAQVMKNNNLVIKDFTCTQLPFLTLTASTRKACFTVKEVEVKTEQDELFPNGEKIILSFTLPSGAYATSFLEYFFILR